MPELSIIVPVYNVDQFLPRCIESILNQTYTDYELILINDGSTDLSAEIIRKYASSDRRIVTFEQSNQGVSAARNRGLEKASGKYISFIDADDWIEKSMYDRMIKIMNQNDVDLVCCNWYRNYEDEREEEQVISFDTSMMTSVQFICHMFDIPRSIGGSNWNKIFVREKIRYHYDETIRFCEDNKFLLQYCIGVQNTFFLKDTLYHLFERADSATRGSGFDILQMLNTRKQLIDIAKEFKIEVKNAAEGDYLDQCKLYLNRADIDSAIKPQIRALLKKYVRDNKWSVFFNPCIFWKQKILYFLT